MGEENSWHSYPKVWALGHANIKELFYEDVVVEEKVDGSQFSFGIINGELRCRSKGQQIVIDAPEKLFIAAVETVKELESELRPGWTYRAEYLAKPKHNVLCYDRVPEKHLIIFDINPGYEEYLDYEEKLIEAHRIGLECVPMFFRGKVETHDELMKLLENKSILGGSQVEGVTCKNYARFDRGGKALMGKYVSEKYKEIHTGDWKKRNPGGKDIIQVTGTALRTPARWEKAIQHLRDDGRLENSPKDIGALMKELHLDLEAECADEIKEILYKWGMPKIKRIVCAGVAEWYKERLAKSQFANGED